MQERKAKIIQSFSFCRYEISFKLVATGSVKMQILAFPRDGARAYLTAVAVAVVQSCMMGTFAGFSVFLHRLSDDPRLGCPSKTTLSLAQSIAQIVMNIAGVAAGAACDRFGVRPVLFFAGVVFMLMPLVTPLANSSAAFVAIFALTIGLSLGSVTSPGPAAIGSWFSESRISLGMGIGESGVAIGTALLPLCAGLLLGHFDDWRTAMQFMALFAVPPIVLSAFIVQRPHDDGDGDDVEKADPTAAAAVADVPDEGWARRLLLTPQFALIFLSQTLFGLGYFGWIFVSVPFAQIMGTRDSIYAAAAPIGVERASALLTYFGVASACGALALGVLGSRLPVRAVLSGSALLGGGAVGVCVVAREYWQLAVLYAFLGVCFAGCLTCLPSMVAEGYAGPHLNKVMSVSFVGFGCGGMAGAPLLAWLQEHVADGGSYTYSFTAAAACLGIVGVVNGGALVAAAASKPSGSDGEARKLLN